MRRYFGWASALLVVGWVACWVAYGLIGSEVDSAGVLQEPFALIPLGWLCLFGALVTGGIYAVLTLRRTNG